MARIALIGASGNAGSRILKELSDRGHQITAGARHPEKIPALPGVVAKKVDATNKQSLVDVIKGHDAVITSMHFIGSDPNLLIDAVRASGVKRYLVVGGAGSLLVAPGQRLVDQPNFPPQYFEEASKGADFLEVLRKTNDLDWTFLSPSALFVPGERTGKFRLGDDYLLTGDQGSTISLEDYAIAMADEIESPKHIRRRFTVGY
jgi:uncharacterized protein